MLKHIWPWSRLEELLRVIDIQHKCINGYIDQIAEMSGEIDALKAAQKIHNKEIGYSPVSTADFMNASQDPKLVRSEKPNDRAWTGS